MAILTVAGGILVATVGVQQAPESVRSLASSLALWASLAMVTIIALARARPAGLLRFRASDLVLGLAAGALLRLAQGLLSGANTAAFPVLAAGGDARTWLWWVGALLPAVAIGPVLEEFVFRAVALVAVYQVLRRPLGSRSAGLTALLASTGGFVILHAAFASLSLVDAMSLALVGAACAGVVLYTGRIWGAVFAHMCYNGLYLLLASAGTILAA